MSAASRTPSPAAGRRGDERRARRGPVPALPGLNWQQRSPWLRAGVYLVLVTVAIIYIYPFLIQLGTAFKTQPESTARAANPIPQTWTTSAFHELTGQGVPFATWFKNSIFLAVSVTLGRLLFDSMAGYALARVRFRGRKAVLSAFVAVLAVPGVVLLIPKFLVFRELGIFDTYTGMIVPLMTDAAGVFIMKGFFEAIPDSIEEAARVDGAGTFRIYRSIVLPMARPALMTLTILSFQGSWNDLSDIVVAQQNPSLDTLTTGVGSLVTGQLGAGNQYPIKMAAALVMTIPVAIVFFTFQKYIIRTGEGSIKG